jgi:hypothetical protein
MALSIHEDIGGLQVSVEHAEVMKMFQGQKDLSDIMSRQLHRQPSRLLQELLHGATSAIVHD